MPLLRRYLLLFIIICCCKIVTAQKYAFIQYTPKDGLVNGRIRSAYQDSKGRMLFMTANGLSVYDGARFTNYTIENGLPNPIVNDVLELGTDSILVATNCHTQSLLIRGKIRNSEDGYCPVINNFFVAKDKSIYAACDEGIFKYEKNRFIKVRLIDENNHKIDGNNKELVTSFDDIQELGDYFILKQYDTRGQENIIFWLNKKTNQCKPLITHNYVYSILQIPDNNILMMGTSKGLTSYDLDAAAKGIIKPVEMPKRFQFLLKLKVSYRIEMDDKRNIWGINSNSVFKLTPDNNLVLFNNTNGLDIVNNMYDFFIDREHVLWILTDGSGVIKLAGSKVGLVTGLYGGFVNSISAINSETGHDSTWLFNEQNQTLYCQSQKRLQQWKLDTPLHIINIQRYKNIIYLLDYVSIYKTELKENVKVINPKVIYKQMPDDEALNFAKAIVDENNNIFASGNLIKVITPKGLSSTTTPSYTDEVAFDQQGYLWTATRTGFLLKYGVHKNDTSVLLELKHNFKNQIPAIDPRSIMIDKRNNIWVGTRFNGVYCFAFDDTVLKRQYHFTVKDGLTDNFVFSIACNENNEIWIGTQSGLDKITLMNERYVIEGITRNNNLFQLTQKVAVGYGNKIWALGNGSVIRVDNENNNSNDYTPQLQITRIKLADSSLEIPSDNITLSHLQNNLTFEVAAPSFIDERQVQFSYMLEGSDNSKWSSRSTQASFTFINLPHGSYTLHIRSFFPVPEYQPQEFSYHFSIEPPWFKTWWFRILILLAGIGLIAWVARTYYKRKLEKQKIIFEQQKAIEKERTRIAMEMHDDLASGLTTIRYLAGGLTLGTSGGAKDKAVKIENSAKELVDNMNDIIWTMKSDNSSLEEMLAYIRKQAAEQLENNSIEYTFDFPKVIPDIKLSSEQKRNLLLISKEAVHNIIKHSKAMHVILKASAENNLLMLSFADDGKGFDIYNPLFLGNGLKNMRKRVEEIGADIDIKNSQGTTVIINVKI